jgi:hypothetical protein
MAEIWETSHHGTVSAMNSRQEIVRQFYQQQVEASQYSIDAFLEAFQSAKIARLELTSISESGIEFDSIEIEQISQDVPASVCAAFERHTWFSQHCLSYVYILKLPVESKTTYALIAIGHVGDGWDGFCQLLEVFDEAGEFLGAVVIIRGQVFHWSDQPFDGDAFPGSPPCHWTGNPTMLENAIWSAQKSIRVEQVGSMTRWVFPWADYE